MPQTEQKTFETKFSQHDSAELDLKNLSYHSLTRVQPD